MTERLTINHSLVKRASAEGYLLAMLITFAATVIGTRVFLDVTAYPQISGGVFHIAHVLWGGLLLFAGGLAPLLFMNRSVYFVSALLTGGGVGLFIDEIGKFITVSNDYFFPLAAPLIYVFFIGVVIVYLRARTSRLRGARGALYHALDRIVDVVDHDLDAAEHRLLLERLQMVLTAKDATEDMRTLAMGMIEVLNEPALQVQPERSAWWERLLQRAEAVEARRLSRRVTRLLLSALLIVFSLSSLSALGLAMLASRDPAWREWIVFDILLSTDPVYSGPNAVVWQIVQIVLQGLMGALVLAGALLLGSRRDEAGTRLALIALIANLTTVSLLTFYYEQFAAVIAAGYQLLLLLGLLRYRRRFLMHGDAAGMLARALTPPTLGQMIEKEPS
jgi:hypothetical protein